MPDVQPAHVEADGEAFVVTERPDLPGQYDVTWTSGPNPGHGFSLRTSDGSALSSGSLEGAIRSFLSQVDPETGYIE